MHWVLVFILFGQSVRPTIDTSLRFSTGAACLAARDAIMVDISGPGRLVCVKDGADPVDKAVDDGVTLPVKNPPKQ